MSKRPRKPSKHISKATWNNTRPGEAPKRPAAARSADKPAGRSTDKPAGPSRSPAASRFGEGAPTAFRGERRPGQATPGTGTSRPGFKDGFRPTAKPTSRFAQDASGGSKPASPRSASGSASGPASKPAAKAPPKPGFGKPVKHYRGESGKAPARTAARSNLKTPGKAVSWGHSAPPSRARLEELLVSHGVTLPGPVLDKVWEYHGILRANNGDLDLTRLIGFETIVQRHYADCLMLHAFMKGNWPSPLVDIGTGAGFPGLMIKIGSPKTKMILAEPRNKRVDFLNATIRSMGLQHIEVFGHKFTSKSFTTPVMGAISRAFEPIQKTLPRLENALQIGGLALFMKGPGVDEELAAGLPPNYRLVRDERYRIPRTTLDRAFIVLERIA